MGARFLVIKAEDDWPDGAALSGNALNATRIDTFPIVFLDFHASLKLFT